MELWKTYKKLMCAYTKLLKRERGHKKSSCCHVQAAVVATVLCVMWCAKEWTCSSSWPLHDSSTEDWRWWYKLFALQLYVFNIPRIGEACPAPELEKIPRPPPIPRKPQMVALTSSKEWRMCRGHNPVREFIPPQPQKPEATTTFATAFFANCGEFPKWQRQKHKQQQLDWTGGVSPVKNRKMSLRPFLLRSGFSKAIMSQRFIV